MSALEKPMWCPECQSDPDMLEWHVANETTNGARGPIIAYLGCEYCSETLAVIGVDAIEDALNAGCAVATAPPS